MDNQKVLTVGEIEDLLKELHEALRHDGTEFSLKMYGQGEYVHELSISLTSVQHKRKPDTNGQKMSVDDLVHVLRRICQESINYPMVKEVDTNIM